MGISSSRSDLVLWAEAFVSIATVSRCNAVPISLRTTLLSLQPADQPSCGPTSCKAQKEASFLRRRNDHYVQGATAISSIIPVKTKGSGSTGAFETGGGAV